MMAKADGHESMKLYAAIDYVNALWTVHVLSWWGHKLCKCMSKCL